MNSIVPRFAIALGIVVGIGALWYGATVGLKSGQEPTTAAAPVLVGAGDIAGCATKDDDETADLLASIHGTVFTVGDNAYPDGSAQAYQECYAASWGRFRDRTRPAVGNHDYATPGASAYFAYFGANAGEFGKGYYSYDLGSWHIVVLNSNCEEVAGGCKADSPQVRWLREDLKSHRALCTLAYWHDPRFSSGVHGSDGKVGPFWEALYDHGADVVIAGNDHDYERFAPQNPGGQLDKARGMVEFVVGTGGARLREFHAIEPNSLARTNKSHGVLRLTLGPDSYAWDFVALPGEPFTDTGEGRCH